MFTLFLDSLLDTLLDSIKMLPFLFATYLILEYLEAKSSNKTRQIIKNSGVFGPIIGAFLGVLPQCGFSVAASNFYVGRVITLGTLISIYLSTSDEMLPIFLAESVNISIILKILFIKCIVGMILGLIIDFLVQKLHFLQFKDEDFHIHDLCEHEHCHCHKSILKPALHHTVRTLLFIMMISFLLNILIGVIGEDQLSSLVLNKPVIGNLIASIVGLTPNCAGSVIITQLFLEGALSSGAMLSGLLVSAGVGLLVLFRINPDTKENLKITALLYTCGAIVGILFDLFQFSF